MSASRVEDIGDVALETEEISKHFGAVRAVDRLSLSIPRGGMTSIVGPNGSGKSTLVNLLSGALPLDGGMVIIDGTGLRVVHAYETPEHGITRTFQEVRLFDQNKRAGQHHSRAYQPGGISVAVRANEVRTQGKGADDSGKRGYVGQARLAGDGAFVWPAEAAGDRPGNGNGREDVPVRRAFAGLFPQMLERVKDIMKLMREEGYTIIFISHNMDIVRELTDHLIVLDSGRLLTQGEVEEVLSSDEVIQAYLGT